MKTENQIAVKEKIIEELEIVKTAYGIDGQDDDYTTAIQMAVCAETERELYDAIVKCEQTRLTQILDDITEKVVSVREGIRKECAVVWWSDKWLTTLGIC